MFSKCTQILSIFSRYRRIKLMLYMLHYKRASLTDEHSSLHTGVTQTQENLPARCYGSRSLPHGDPQFSIPNVHRCSTNSSSQCIVYPRWAVLHGNLQYVRPAPVVIKGEKVTRVLYRSSDGCCRSLTCSHRLSTVRERERARGIPSHKQRTQRHSSPEWIFSQVKPWPGVIGNE